MKVLLSILKLRLLLMFAGVVLVFYLLSNFICNFDKHLFLFFVIIRSFLLEWHDLIILEYLLAPLIYLCLCHYELWKFLSLLACLLRFEVVEFVVPRETVNQTEPGFSVARNQLLLLKLAWVWLRVNYCLDIRLNYSLHLPLPSSETLFDIVFLEEVHKRLINLVLADLVHLPLLEILLD